MEDEAIKIMDEIDKVVVTTLRFVEEYKKSICKDTHTIENYDELSLRFNRNILLRGYNGFKWHNIDVVK